MARGERPEIPPVGGTYEEAQLAAAMSRMSEAVAEREDELRAQAERLEQTVRSRDEFLALVSHDLKNPLAAIRSTAGLIRRQVDRGVRVDPAVLARASEVIDRATVRAAGQIDELLDIAQLQSGQSLELACAPVDIVALVQAVVAEAQQSTERHVIKLEAEGPELVGEWDAARLDRAVGNLLNNAIKYSPDGGDITLRIARENQQAVIEVSDHGLGIPEGALPRIFDRFFRAENVVGHAAGTGLGLSGVRYVVEAHGGTIDVVSKEGEGSTFTVRVPLSQD